MRAVRLPTLRASVATRCQYQEEMRGLWSDAPQVNKFEQVSSLGHQMPEPCGIEGTEVNKFVQVSSCGHQMSLLEGPYTVSGGGGG